MPKRSDTKEIVILALEMMRRIPKGRKTTAPELHRQLTEAGIERDLRTIQRQLDMLCENFDIECDASSRPYGYRWKERASGFSAPGLSPQEALLLRLAESHLRALLPANVLKSMDSFFQQARSELGPHKNARLEREWLDKVRVVPESLRLLPPKLKPEVLERATSALYGNQWLTVDYTNASGQQAQHELMPLGLAQQGPRLYLAGRYRNSDETRIFALHRVTKAVVSSERFARPADFSLAAFDAEGRFGFGEGSEVRVSFRIDEEFGRHLRETPLSNDQEISQHGNWLHVSATVADSEHLTWWLRGFGRKVRGVTKAPIQ